MDNEDLKKRLTEEEYFITQEKGTETPFRNEYWDKKESGMYECKVCGQALFDSSRKYDSGTGWPSFDEALPGVLKFEQDHSLGAVRTEVMCSMCGSHLGHIFDDGPKETTGKRICTNSASLRFKSKS